MTHKLLFFLSVLTFCLLACSEQKPKETTQESPKTEAQATPIVGNDSDEHGCKPSAGYTWSFVKNAQAANLDKSVSAFVIFKSDTDDAQAELYLPTEKKSILLAKQGKENAGIWKNETYTLTQWKGMYSLEDAKKTLLYQGMIGK
jgi:hypothetical protein